ncbi:hypothetical protein [Cellvibrio sp. NN19]|uniref:hypothetical protein n=1 Tax=Cellvibrio chitinivorans TaxID=3102792 RepID=UPI002B40A672|nr:hypothetical protein [Cellvibrio sp. NN19]
MFKYSKLVLLAIFFLHGCEQNNDIAQLSAYPSFGSCAIDIPAHNATVSSDSEFTIAGWAFDEKNKTVPDTLTLNLINEKSSEIFTFPAKRGIERPDVAAAFKLPILVESGFSGIVTKNSLTPGDYRIVLLQGGRNAGVISCGGESHRFTVH